MKNIKKESCFILLLLYAVICTSQGKITGLILDENSNPIVDASIITLENNKGVTSNNEGKFSVETIPGTYTLEVSFIGYKKHTKTVRVKNTETVFLTILLEENINELSNVVVTGKTNAQKTREKAFEVEVIETEALKNVSADINSVLAVIPGVSIRQQGGLGSAFNFSLNGLTGKKVKFFMDGIPMDNYGSSLSLNNFPATLVEQIEVYKGVVPIFLGADALAGAVNIITNQRKNDFLDVSYDIGSFNTHRATLNGQHFGENGFAFKISSFYNHSDNNYKIYNIEVRDALGNDTGVRRNNVERFHDAYNSQMVTIKSGVVDKKYADHLMLGITASGNKNEIQHPIDPQNPFGEVFTENDFISGSIEYEKKNLLKDKLKLKIYASIAHNQEKVVDTTARKYDWFGNFVERGNQTLGEFETSKTLFKFKDNLHLINTSISYKINNHNRLHLNYTKNYIKRIGEDPATTRRISFQDPHIVNKSIVGLSYDFDLIDAKWDSSIFTKGYFLNSEGNIVDLFTNIAKDRFTPFQNTFEELGYGFASTYKFTNDFQIKGSFERTFRIPEGYEFFGDGLLLKSNPELQPEKSYNANLGALLNTRINDFKLQLDTNIFLREFENFIVIESEGIFTKYNNRDNARSSGAEAEIKTLFKDKFYLDINATYQNVKDINQNQRIANIPYLFGNLNIGAKFKNLITKDDQFNISWNTYSVQEYPLDSYINGSEEDRFNIKAQTSHNLQLGYSLNDGKYNLSLSAKNITDANIYDNFDIQLAGSAFYLKFRYYISN